MQFEFYLSDLRMSLVNCSILHSAVESSLSHQRKDSVLFLIFIGLL